MEPGFGRVPELCFFSPGFFLKRGRGQAWLRCWRWAWFPHPNPLPEGEGTCVAEGGAPKLPVAWFPHPGPLPEGEGTCAAEGGAPELPVAWFPHPNPLPGGEGTCVAEGGTPALPAAPNCPLSLRERAGVRGSSGRQRRRHRLDHPARESDRERDTVSVEGTGGAVNGRPVTSRSAPPARRRRPAIIGTGTVVRSVHRSG